MPAALPGVLARSTIVLFGDSLTQRGRARGLGRGAGALLRAARGRV